jgi:hypothetical protein
LEINGLSLRALETVDFDTPASNAKSDMVARFPIVSHPEPVDNTYTTGCTVNIIELQPVVKGYRFLLLRICLIRRLWDPKRSSRQEDLLERDCFLYN